MSYESEQLADTPALFWRLNNVGAAANGDEITDLSGNDLHGTLEYIQPGTTPEAYGYPSPIETDPTSVEFRGFNDGIFAATRVSRIGAGTDPLIEPSGDFALEGWLRLPAAVGGGAQFGTIMQPMFGRTGSTFIYIDHFNKIAGCVIDTAGDGWLVVNPDAVEFGQSYHVVLERVGNALALRVDTILKDTATITSGLPNRMDAPGTFLNASGGVQDLPGFFVHPFQVSACDARYDEVAYYTHSLGSTRTTVHYESAINATLLNGFSNVVPSAILYSDLEPDPVSYPFRHNWSQNLIERIGFMSGLSTTVSGREEGNGVRPNPRREIEFAQVIRDNAERQDLRAKIKAYQDRKWFIPILEHREQLLVPLSSGATSIPASTQYKDYEVDSYVHLREFNDAGQITKSEYLQIESLTGSDVVSATPTVNAYAAYLSQVCPARRCYLPPSIQSRGHTAEVEELILTARLLAEDESATPNRIVEWTPTITYKGYEVHDPSVWQSNDWSDPREYDVERSTHDVDFETGIFELESDTAGAAEAFSYSVKLKGLEQIAKFLGWFYYHAGSLVYLWVASMQRDFTIVSAVGSNLTVSGHIYTEIYAGSEARRDLAFVYNNNTMILRRINSSTTSGSNDVLTLNTTVPTQTNLRSVSFLKFCRIDADSLEKALSTDDVMLATWRFRELLHSPD
jgi:hypothetical protein